MVESLLDGLAVIYLLDDLNLMTASTEEREGWFQDYHHLTDDGHLVWGKLMRAHLERLGYLRKEGVPDGAM